MSDATTSGPGTDDGDQAYDIAVIGLAARLPGASDATEFWDLLATGRDASRPISDQEFLAAGGDPADLKDPSLVRRISTVEGIEEFDAAFFNLSPADAELLDPQQRLLLECAYHALEDAGHASTPEDPQDPRAPIVGVYAGADDSHYYPAHVHPRFAHRPSSVAATHAAISNSLGALATRLSYHLGLTGPSLTVQTTCSTALVALHTACQELLAYHCDIALTAAASINTSAPLGYHHTPDGPFSPDGRVRAFDANAQGTADGNGVGVVVLKRLEDALADGDRIRAVIKGSAVNNDGRRKVGFTAPSLQGQHEVILQAQQAAGIDADTIGYVEAHGTGTRLGDPIEVAALTTAFRTTTTRHQYCALGSVKTNIGHLGAAAGMAGLLKAVLALEHQAIPPNLHFENPNPLIDFTTSPFYVPTTLTPWPHTGSPRRAAVSAFGVGGTNAHVILEEAPHHPTPPAPPAPQDRPRILPLSAHTPTALRQAATDLAEHLTTHPHQTLADTAHSLRVQRPPMPHRTAVVATTTLEATHLLTAPPPTHTATSTPPPVAFLLPGGGTQYVGMGAGLYRDIPLYRETIDDCARILTPHLARDLRTDLFQHTEPASIEAFLSLVATQYALARTLIAHGVRPAALIGHSLGEYTAACLAGVLSLDQMLPLVATRLRLIIAAGGATTSVALGEADLAGYLTDDLSLAAVNGPTACTVAGPERAIAALEAKLTANDITHRRLRMPAAAHSLMLDPVLDTFATALEAVDLHPPRIPYITNVTGTWTTDTQARDTGHWLAHTRHTVRFADGITTLCQAPTPLLLEVGPGTVLTTLARTTPAATDATTLTTMRHAKAERPDTQVLGEALARLWSTGLPIDLTTFNGDHTPNRRVPLPPYPFDRHRHWIPAPHTTQAPTTQAPSTPNAQAPNAQAPAPTEPPRPRTRAPRPHLAAPYTPPTTTLERLVTDHWEQVLAISGIGTRDNFFDLGGDSMRAVLLTSQLRTAGVLDIPVTRLLATPTIAALTADTTDHDGALAPVLALRAEGTRRPLFCVHPSIGTAWCYTALLPGLGPDQPLYGLQAHGLDGHHAPAEHADQMVRDYLTHLRAIQPHGPYRLLGGSYGGMVAHAMATELRRQGEQVELLAMMDSPLPAHLAQLPVPTAEEAQRQVQAILTGDGSTLPLAPEDVRAMARVFANNLRISPGFTPSLLDGDLLFFTATDHGTIPQGLPAPTRATATQPLATAWQQHLTGTVHNHQLTCGHYEMTRPEHIAQVGRTLAHALAALDRKD
ncbi:type I polyketide synthase [Kitasatospora sp. NPDC052896]|uniref:type I polyketide synthase n=1 Tax=Kitasatospora sp. NPDC052896 TaxID=3364061 RepID=UPI0037C62DA7